MNERNFLLKHFDKSVELIHQFGNKEPLHFYLKKYFVANKQHGSRDRKIIAHFCYSFFRIGKNLLKHSIEERLKIALFLCENSLQNYAILFSEDWLQNHAAILSERINFIQKKYPEFLLHNIFSFENELPETIDTAAFQQSFLIQPKVFLRIRNGKEKIVFDKLHKANIRFERVEENCISVPQNINIETVLQLNKEVVVQDLSSQKIRSFLSLANQPNHLIHVWDCCAASGGKSILAKDILNDFDLTVSDIRPQILHNLKQRFREAGISHYKSFVADLSKPISVSEKFNLIICDAPCSGSGTWSRTPEMLAAFDLQQINVYQSLQKSIVTNCIPQLKNDGYFLYITCSVFRKENEEMIQFIEDNFSLVCIKSELIKGYAQRADSMFAALFTFKK